MELRKGVAWVDIAGEVGKIFRKNCAVERSVHCRLFLSCTYFSILLYII